MRTGKIRPQGKVINAWQLLHESDFEDTDTKLLLHLDGDITDYATGKTVTNNGSASYSTTIWKLGSQSISLNGSSQYLSVADSADWNFGSGNFTVDFCVQFAGLPTDGNSMYLLSQWSISPSADRAWSCWLENSGGTYYFSFQGSGDGTAGGAYWYKQQAVTVSTGVWYHLAVTRSGNTLYMFQDGVQVATLDITGKSVFDSGAVLSIGAYKDTGESATAFLNGYMDEIRVVKGTAKWTSNFTPPTAPYLGRTTTYPITRDMNTVLMISGQGADASTSIIDETGKAITANGTAQIDTAQYKFGASSILLDGNSDYLTLADSSDWYFGSNNFTIDFWVRFNSLPDATPMMICGQWVDGSNHWWVTRGSTVWEIYADNGGVLVDISKTSTISTGVWYHIAVVRNGNDFTIYQNGLSLGSSTDSSSMPELASSLYIGQRGDSSRYFDGWLADIRISKGLARWTSNFTPPLKTTALINGDTDEMYRLVSMPVIVGSGSSVWLEVNNDSGSNYGEQRLRANSSTASAAQTTNRTAFKLNDSNSAGDASLSDNVIYVKSGYQRLMLTSINSGIAGTTVTQAEIDAQVWNNTTQPIASLEAYGGANDLGLGTKFLLYRKVI